MAGVNTDLNGYLQGNVWESTVSSRIDKVALGICLISYRESTRNTRILLGPYTNLQGGYGLYWDISRALAKIEVSILFAMAEVYTYMAMNTDFCSCTQTMEKLDPDKASMNKDLPVPTGSLPDAFGSFMNV